ncbi:MAG: signal peptidase II [Chloroflexota bacterium]
MSLSTRRWAFLFATIGVVLLIDQVTKTLIVLNMTMSESVQPIPALYPFFQITRSFNTGSAFGFMAGSVVASYVFLVLAFVISGFLIWSYAKIEDGQPLARLATGMIVGGALGNAIDRIIYSHVVDFIHYQIPNVISNVSNLADHAIVFGVALMIWSSWQAQPGEESADMRESVPLPDGDD